MCEICVAKAKEIKRSGGKVWDGSTAVYLESQNLTIEEIAAILQEESEWDAMSDDG